METQTSRKNFTTEQKDFIIKVIEQQLSITFVAASLFLCLRAI